ncbi:MAG: sulfotransferase [Gallionella sp.]|nr:sulfotransferase [Gallionella sp.]
MTDIINNQPVFLVASVRTGSTLLRLMLDSHPNIVNPGECDFLFDQVSDDGTPPDVDRYREWLKFDRIFLGKKLDVDPTMNYAGLMDSFVNQMQQHDSVIVMNVHRHFFRIPKIFPRAKYIHLIRDGRDVARSCIGMGWVGNVYYGIDTWRDAETAWEKLKDTLHPSQYMEIKYEDLLEDVELGLGQICQFLGVAYSESMMDYASKSTYSLPDKRLSYQWKTKYNRRELSLVESKVGDMLLSRGYELSGVFAYGPSLIEKAELYVQNKWFRIRRQVSAYGFSLFLQYYLARKLGISQWERALKAKINAANAKMLK